MSVYFMSVSGKSEGYLSYERLIADVSSTGDKAIGTKSLVIN
jgi:hypothetical protein